MFVERFQQNNATRRIKETLFIFWIFGVIILFLALLTHSNDDVAIAASENPEFVQNSIGTIGAHISQILFEWLGFPAYLLPILICYIGYLLFYNSGMRFRDINYGVIGVRIIGCNLLLCSVCTLVNKASIDTVDNKGGILGYALYEMVHPYLGYTGTILFMFGLFLVGIVNFTGVSLFAICEKVGAIVVYPFIRTNGKDSFIIRMMRKVGLVKAEDFNEAVSANANASSNAPQKNTQEATNANDTYIITTAEEFTKKFAKDKAKNVKNAQELLKSEPEELDPNLMKVMFANNLDEISSSDVQNPVLESNFAKNPSNEDSTLKDTAQVFSNEASIDEDRFEPIFDIGATITGNVSTPQSAQVQRGNQAATDNPSSIDEQTIAFSQSRANSYQPSNALFAGADNNAATANESFTNEPLNNDSHLGGYANTYANSNPDGNINFNNQVVDNEPVGAVFTNTSMVTSAFTHENMGNNPVTYALKNTALEQNQLEGACFFTNSSVSSSVTPNLTGNDNFNSSVNANAATITAATTSNEFLNNAQEVITTSNDKFFHGSDIAEDLPKSINDANAPNNSQFLVKEEQSNVINLSEVRNQNGNSDVGMVPDGFKLVETNIAKQNDNNDAFAGFVKAGEEKEAPSSFTNTFTNASAGNVGSLNNSVTSFTQGGFSNPNNQFTQTPVDAQNSYNSLSSNTATTNVNDYDGALSVNSSDGYRYINAGSDLSESLGFSTKTKLRADDLGPFPTVQIFAPPEESVKVNESEILDVINRINQSFKHFNVPAHVATEQVFDQFGNPRTKYLYQYGPVITRYKVKLEKGLAKAIVNISNDIARFLCVGSMRVIEVIPGEPYIGLEIPNAKRGFINMRSLLESDEFNKGKFDLPMVIGKDIVGNPVVLDLVKAPHLLVAGTTGSGKSVGIGTMLVSLLMKHTPKELRLILIDPKMLEFSMYHDIPHLLTPVITDVKQAPSALRWCVQEMERRYTIMSKLNVKKITDYNALIETSIQCKTRIIDPTWKPTDDMSQVPPNLDKFPFIVIVVDEFADLILQLKKNGDVEGLLARLAAKARACGIHLILATQSPRADVITGVIRSNFPSQIAFKVKSNQESRIILDESGAESLLGCGDMLIKFNDGTNVTRRAHGAYIKDSELEMFAESWRRRGKPEYVEAVTKTELTEENALPGEIVPQSENKDAIYDDVVEFCRTLKLNGKKFSTSLIQRQFSIGYNRAARITTTLERNGIVSDGEGSNGAREILIEVNNF